MKIKSEENTNEESNRQKKNIISHVKGTLDTILRVEANSASCCIIYEPESPKGLSKFKRKTK